MQPDGSQTRLPVLLTILVVILAAIFVVEYIQFNSSSTDATATSDSANAASTTNSSNMTDLCVVTQEYDSMGKEFDACGFRFNVLVNTDYYGYRLPNGTQYVNLGWTLLIQVSHKDQSKNVTFGWDPAGPYMAYGERVPSPVKIDLPDWNLTLNWTACTLNNTKICLTVTAPQVSTSITSSSEPPLANSGSGLTQTVTTVASSNQSQVVTHNTTSTVQMTTITQPITLIVTPQEFLQAGGRAAIIGSFNVEEVSVTRGKTVDVVLTLSYLPGADPLPNIIVTPQGDTGGVIPASVAAQSTPHERAEMLKQNKTIPGSLSMSDLTSFEPNSISLKPNESKQIVVHITVPENWPEEMVGKEISISPSFLMVSSKVGFFPDGIEVKITG